MPNSTTRTGPDRTEQTKSETRPDPTDSDKVRLGPSGGIRTLLITFPILLQDSLHGFPGLFTVTSEHIPSFTFYFLVFLFIHFLLVGFVQYIKPTHVGFRVHVKIASRIVSFSRRCWSQ